MACYFFDVILQSFRASLTMHKCLKCSLHGRTVPLKNHKKICPYRSCDCIKCKTVVTYRQNINRKRRSEVFEYPIRRPWMCKNPKFDELNDENDDPGNFSTQSLPSTSSFLSSPGQTPESQTISLPAQSRGNSLSPLNVGLDPCSSNFGWSENVNNLLRMNNQALGNQLLPCQMPNLLPSNDEVPSGILPQTLPSLLPQITASTAYQNYVNSTSSNAMLPASLQSEAISSASGLSQPILLNSTPLSVLLSMSQRQNGNISAPTASPIFPVGFNSNENFFSTNALSLTNSVKPSMAVDVNPQAPSFAAETALGSISQSFNVLPTLVMSTEDSKFDLPPVLKPEVPMPAPTIDQNTLLRLLLQQSLNASEQTAKQSSPTPFMKLPNPFPQFNLVAANWQ
ncbi:unnamed protein product [Bursaphelenchus xylophilus]|uniref:(pine wood nematode) hypothetical protein n=1 Tax=Bursaphelenchus xylophilus TaxID=6326 RepID=A0A1I7RW43_BURXY|nr:unnamed protein product [Bursaphelenchus xylophilus]CAG9095101.1 unnamed protein product [Bursaphelenchus xylophilus]